MTEDVYQRADNTLITPARQDAYRRAFTHRALGIARVTFVVLAAVIMAAGAESLGIGTVQWLGISGVALLFSLIRLRWPRGPRTLPLEYLDFVLAFGLIAYTGGTHSPLVGAVIVFIVGVTLQHGPPAALVGSAVGILGLVVFEPFRSAAQIADPAVLLVGRSASILLAGFMIASLAEMERRLRRAIGDASVTDPLTGLLNRRYLDARMAQEIARRRRYGGHFTILYMDVDGLKKVNDRYGHQVGDAYLAHLGETLANAVRSGEDLVRYGGDEFILLMPAATQWDAEQAAARIRRRLSDNPMHHGTRDLPLRLSIGIAEYPTHGRSTTELLNAADQSMYRKKTRQRGAATSAG